MKADAAAGNLTYERAFTIIRDFKEDYLQDFERRVVNNDLNRRRAATTLKEQSLGIILNEFHNMEREKQLLRSFTLMMSRITILTKFFIYSFLLKLYINQYNLCPNHALSEFVCLQLNLFLATKKSRRLLPFKLETLALYLFSK